MRIVAPSGLAPLTDLIPISPSPPVRFSTITERSSGWLRFLRDQPAERVAAAAGREGKDDFGERPGLGECIARSRGQCQTAIAAKKLRRSMFPSPTDDLRPLHQIRLDQSPAFGQMELGARYDRSTGARGLLRATHHWASSASRPQVGAALAPQQKISKTTPCTCNEGLPAWMPWPRKTF